MTACLSLFYFTFVSLFYNEFLSIADIHAGNIYVSNTASLQVVYLSVIGFLSINNGYSVSNIGRLGIRQHRFALVITC